MTDLDVYALAAVLNQKDNEPNAALKLRRGVVVSVSGGTATVTIGGVNVAGIPFYRDAWLNVGDVVDVLLDGPAPRVIGVLASSGGAGSVGMVKIAEVILGADASVIDIQNIPATFRSLELIHDVQSTRGANTDGLRVRMNNDASAAYDIEEFVANAATLSGQRTLGATLFPIGEIATEAFITAGGRLLLHRYNDPNVWTEMENIAGSNIASVGPWAFMQSGNWKNTATVNRLTLFSSTGSNLRAGSRAVLYGLT